MACYWGCGTSTNKWVYVVMICFMVAGGAIAVAGGISGATGQKCFQLFNDCIKATDDKKGCADLAQDTCHYKTYTSLIFAGVIIFLVGGFAPMSWFCCCSTNPDQKAGGAVYPGVAVSAHPVAAPVMAQPYQPNQPHQPNQAAVGQPIMAQTFDPNTMK